MKKWVIVAVIALLLLLASCGPPMLMLIAMTSATAPSPRPPDQVDGIPPTLLDAYVRGAQHLEELHPACTNMTWMILAGIGRIESTHGAGHHIDANGDVTPPFIGPRLDGSGVGGNLTPHYDTDGGRWDGDTEYDRAVGLTQHLPANWARYGRDGNGDGVADPHNAYDSVLSTAVELCTSGGGDVDFGDRAQLDAALYRYNPSRRYVADVLHWIDAYTEANGAQRPRPGANGSGSAIIEAAEDWLGTPYLYGGACNVLGQDRCDCSSLARYAYRHGADIELPRVTYDQVRLPEHDPRFTAIPGDRKDLLQPGDMLFFGHGYPHGLGHVGLYISPAEMIHAPRTGRDVVIEGWQQRSNYYGAVGLR